MTTPYESATLILKLFELRRDPLLRQARDWFLLEFHPRTIEEVQAALASEHNPRIRMVLGYWDMACSLVTHGAIDAAMFRDASGEIIGTFSKVEPLLADWRRTLGRADYLRHMEEVVMGYPDAADRLATMRKRLAAAGAARAERAAEKA
jgi:hypothetical protein